MELICLEREIHRGLLAEKLPQSVQTRDADRPDPSQTCQRAQSNEKKSDAAAAEGERRTDLTFFMLLRS